MRVLEGVSEKKEISALKQVWAKIEEFRKIGEGHKKEYRSDILDI